MPADALKCKECSTTYPLEARYVCERCFGPLEVAYSPPAGEPDELRRRIQAGPHTLWRYADFLPLERVPRASLPTGLTPLVRADRLAERNGWRGFTGPVPPPLWMRPLGPAMSFCARPRPAREARV